MPDANRHDSMYVTEAMNVGTGVIEEEEEEDVVAGGVESIDDPRVRYEHQGMKESAVVEGSIEAMNGVEVVEGHAFCGLVAEFTQNVGNGSADQLSLSFEGEVYVFDSVSPDKVCFL